MTLSLSSINSSVKPSIFSQSREELTAQLQAWGESPFRSKQMSEWLFTHRVFDIESMSNLPKTLKVKLLEHFDWSLPEIVSHLDSEDGASKLLIQSAKNQVIEAVILRYEGRTSLCISSQVGCKLACRFCQTGKLGFFRHLNVGEIMSQFILAQNIVKKEDRRITHVVFMGMGEPLDNFDNIVKVCNLLTKDFGLSARKVTVSTSGIADKISDLAKQTNIALAVSLHACRDDLRSELMPINKRFPLSVLKEALLQYQRSTDDVITFEYIMIKDKNCSIKEAKELVHFIHGFRAKVNLIPFNDHPGLEYARPSDDEIRQFQKYLSDRSIVAPVRYSKGAEVSAACGQLAAKHKESIHAAPLRKSVIQG